MKKGKIILSVAAFVTAIGGIFAFKSNKAFTGGNIYTSSTSGTYTIVASEPCYFPKHLSANCGTFNSTAKQYYYYTANGSFLDLPSNAAQQLYTLPH